MVVKSGWEFAAVKHFYGLEKVYFRYLLSNLSSKPKKCDSLIPASVVKNKVQKN